MNWVLVTLVAAFLYGIVPLLQRRIARDAPVFGYTFALHLFGLLFITPLFLFQPVLPTTSVAWLLLGIATAVWIGGMLLNTISLKRTHASLRPPLMQTQLVWSVLLAFIILREAATFLRVAGAALVLAGALLASFDHVRKRDFTRTGVVVTLLTAATWGVADIFDKSAMAYFEPVAYSFFMYLFITVILLCALPRYASETKKFFRTDWTGMLVLGLLSMAIYTLSMAAYQHLDLSVVATLFAAGDMVTVIGAMVVFPEERTSVARKVVATIIVICGVALAALAA